MHCPTCSAELGGKAVCPRCGTLVGIESGAVRIGAQVRQYVDDKLAALPRRVEPRYFLWACAVMPLFLLPPLVSLIYAFLVMRRERDGTTDTNIEWLAIISALNLLLTGVVLYKFHFAPSELIQYLIDALRSFIQNRLHFSPPGVPPTIMTPA